MAGKRQIQSTGRWEFVIKRAGLLPKPWYLTFKTEAEGESFCARAEKMLDLGIVPPEFQESATAVVSVADLIQAYEHNAHPSEKDKGTFGTTLKAHGKLPLVDINAQWVDSWITEMKRAEKLAPATIRARVGALARCTDWGVRKAYLLIPDNALRNLPDGYAQYTHADVAAAGVKRVDIERDRRLEAGEFARIMAVLDQGVLPRKQRPLVLDTAADLRVLITLAVESAMRLREMYTLTTDQVDLKRRTVFLDHTKNGDKRQVPLSTVAVQVLTPYLGGRERVFPWWDGSLKLAYLKKISDELSKLAGKVFAEAGCADLTFHDLRHEATSRLFERTTLSDAQIMKITGHKSIRMLMRYANLRGSDLATRLW